MKETGKISDTGKRQDAAAADLDMNVCCELIFLHSWSIHLLYIYILQEYQHIVHSQEKKTQGNFNPDKMHIIEVESIKFWNQEVKVKLTSES